MHIVGVSQCDVGGIAGGAVSHGDLGNALDGVAVHYGEIMVAGKIDRGYACLVEGHELARIGHAVLVCIPPNAERAPFFIKIGKRAVMIAVKGGQGFQVGLRPVQITGKDNLRPVIRYAVTIDIIDQQAVARFQPGNPVFPTITVDIEKHI